MSAGIRKVPTGISGLDELTAGGLPAGRPTLVCGGAGCGKTLLAMEFLVRGATRYGEPGVFVAFEENERELAENAAALGLDLPALQEQGLLAIDHVRVERAEIEETGEYDLEALFVRIGYAIDSVGAKRVVLDTVEALFSALPSEGILRSELRRLFRWLKDRGVTAIITAERGAGPLTRHGLEEYVSDCVLLLDHRVQDQISTRRLRVVKYRGSAHGTNEYPFLIGNDGFAVLPVTSVGLTHPASEERVPTGVPRLDEMLGGRGYYRGSSVLVSGGAGTGKTTLAAHFAAAACARGDRCLYFAFEESPAQLLRNMRSVGIPLHEGESNGLLAIRSSRPSLYGLETHLAVMHHEVTRFAPDVVVIDPVTNLLGLGSPTEVRSMLTRLLDHLKGREVTLLATNYTDTAPGETTEIGMSSLIDTWLLLRDLEHNGERNRALYVLKSRGMPHSNQVREFTISDQGVGLVDVAVGAQGVLVGSARVAEEVRLQAAARDREREIAARAAVFAKKRAAVEAQIAALHTELAAEEAALGALASAERDEATATERDRSRIAAVRQGANNEEVGA